MNAAHTAAATRMPFDDPTATPGDRREQDRDEQAASGSRDIVVAQTIAEIDMIGRDREVEVAGDERE